MHTLPDGFVSGFGTVMTDERELRALLRTGMVHGQSYRPLEMGRIYHRRDEQVDAIIALLRERQSQLPGPDRFDALNGPLVPRTHADGHRPLAAATLAELVALNQRLIDAIETLRKVGGQSGGGEPLLAAAAQRHRELAQTLAPLVEASQGHRVSLPNSGFPA